MGKVHVQQLNMAANDTETLPPIAAFTPIALSMNESLVKRTAVTANLGTEEIGFRIWLDQSKILFFNATLHPFSEGLNR